MEAAAPQESRVPSIPAVEAVQEVEALSNDMSNNHIEDSGENKLRARAIWDYQAGSINLVATLGLD